jgi:hypothetical protein
MDAINERKERESEVIKDTQDREKKAYEESLAAYKQAEQEKLDDKKKNIEASFTEERALYDGQQKMLKIQQDEAARKSGESAGLLLARNMVTNAEPTIIAMLDKIKSLPQELQLSTFSDFFGDEARGLFPMINNTQKLAEMLRVANDETKNMGSVTAEAGVMMETTAAQMRLAKNAVENLQIEIGNQLLPIVNALIPGFTGMVQAVTGFAEANPLLTQIAIGIGAIGAAAVIALPVVAGLGMAIKTIAGFGLGATLAGWVGAFPAVTAGLAGIATTIKLVATGLAALVAGFVTAPILIGAAAVATAVVIFNFRDQIADAFRGLADLIVNPESGLIASVGGGWNIMMDGIKDYAGNILTNLGENWTAFFDTIIGPENGLIARLGQTWNAGMDAMRDYAVGLVRPVTDAWRSIVGTVRGVINSALSLAGRAVNAFIEQINRLIQAANSVSSAVGGPQLGQIQPVEVPSFAGGGYTGNGSRSGGLDGQGGFMAMVHPQEQIIDLQRSPSRTSAGGAAAGGSRGGGTFAPVFNLAHNGPVYRLPDGTDAVSLADAVAIAEDAADRMWNYAQSVDGRKDLGIFR